MKTRKLKFPQQHQDQGCTSYAPEQQQASWINLGVAAVGAVGSYASSRKNKPGAPVYQTPLDIQKEGKTAIDSNIANEGGIEALLSRGNAFQQDQASSLLEKAMPGYSKLAGNLTKLATDISGNPYGVPKEVEDNLSRIAAEKGISSGARGQFSDFSLLRDLGVNQLNYGSQRISQAQGLTSLLSGIAPKTNPMSPLNFYVSPNNALDAANGNATNAQATGQSYNNAKAAADSQNSTNMWNDFGKLAGLTIGAITSKNGGSGGNGYNDV